MKPISLLIMLLCLLSCGKIEKEGPFVYGSKIISKHHEDKRTEITYHWGYSFRKKEFCYHLGPEEIPEKNIVSYEFLENIITEDNKALFKSDSILIYYSRVFRVTKDKTLFLRTKIDSVVNY